MHGYPANFLSKFQHDNPKHSQHKPSKYVTPVYRAKTQYATRDETPPLSAKQCINIQKITGSVLYYARAVDPTLCMPFNEIATDQKKPQRKHKHQQISYGIGLYGYSTGSNNPV
jgi:hypothetical protein